MTNPLRSDVAQRAMLGKWLRVQTETIAAPWIAAIHSRRTATEQPVAPAIDQAIYQKLYQNLALALETGRYASLDESLTEITIAGRAQGYQLQDLIQIATMLKNDMWQAIVTAYPPEEALGYVHTIDILFQTALSYQTRVFSDLTQREANQTLNLARGELEKVNETKSRFINIAAHELKTPLTLIQGYADMLSQELSDSADEQVRHVLTGLRIGTRRLLATVNDMIVVSMIDSRALMLNYQIVALPHIIQMVLNELRPTLRERDLTVVFKPAPIDLGPFYADPQRIYQIFDYIVTNSIKYTPDGGRITIELKLIPGRDPFVEVCVIDTGIGIAPEDLPYVFEKLYDKTDVSRHSSSRTNFKGGGVGLGLSVVKGIVDAHGGKIVIESPGHDEQKFPGTTVRIFLPILSRPPAIEPLPLDLESKSS